MDADTGLGQHRHGQLWHWQPIVVDVPTAAFDPKPPPPGPYRPDTLCDGWSSSHFTVRLASVRGYAHRFSGTARQDSVEVRVHPGTGILVFAVADGVSEAPLSHEGSAIACGASVRAVLTVLDRDANRVPWYDVLWRAATELTNHARHWRLPDAGAALATTLVVGIVRPEPTGGRVTVVQVGDSSAWLLHYGRYVAVLGHKAIDGSAVVRSTVAALPLLPDEVQPVELDLPAEGVLLVGTDGFGDPLGDGTGLVGELFADVLATPPPPLGLAHALDFSRETFDDDRTLVAIWPTVGRGTAS